MSQTIRPSHTLVPSLVTASLFAGALCLLAAPTPARAASPDGGVSSDAATPPAPEAPVPVATPVGADGGTPPQAAPIDGGSIVELAAASSVPVVGPPPQTTELSAVVVTAQKREQKLQDVPLAITVVNGDNLAHAPTIKTAQDIIQYIPNASASSADGRTRPRWFLRGIGTNETAASTVSPIGIYADDVFLNNVYLQAFPIFDLERVEVLRGPQGTLWGKNTTGGAIHFLSKKPSFETDGYARLGYGTYQEQAYQAGLGGALIKDLVAGRISFFTEKRNGWVYNEATGRNSGALFDTAARAQVLISPTDNFEALLIAKLRRLDAEKNPRFYVLNPERPEDLKNPIYAGPLRGRDAISQAGVSQDLFNEDGYSAKLNWFFYGHTLTSITAYERGRRIDVGGSSIALDIGRSRAFTQSRQGTQELRLTSPANQRVSWIAGLYYFRETLQSSTATRADAVPGASTASASPTALSKAAFGLSDYDQTTTSFAPFASATAKLTEKLSLIGGLRWSTETKSFDTLRLEAPAGFQFNNNEAQWWLPASVNRLNPPLASTNEHTWSELTYDATLQYKINRNANTYVRYAHGFRAGGYVVAADYSATQLNPETLNATEVGLKTQWLQGKLTFNTALFNYDYKDIIVGVLLPIPGTTMTRQVQENAAEGYSRGAEFEVSWKPRPGLRVQGNLGLLATKYTNYSSSASGDTIQANGNRFTRAPSLTSALDVEYSVPLPGTEDSLGVGTDWSFRTRQYFNAVNQHDPTLWQDAYALGNARLFYRTNRGKVELSLYVRNITDAVYSILSTGPANGLSSQVYGLPRTVGGALYMHF